MAEELLQMQKLMAIWGKWKNESRDKGTGLKFNQNALNFWIEGIRYGMQLANRITPERENRV